MKAFHDQIIATIAAAGILITTGNLQAQRSHQVVNQARLQGNQVAMDAFADVVAQDVRSMGSGVPTGEPMILDASASAITFRGTAGASGDASTVAYVRTNEVNEEGQPVVRIQREVDGVATARSPQLSAFSLDFMDAGGGAVGGSGLADARRVRVRAELAMPTDNIAARAPVRQVGWETELAPSNLARAHTPSQSHPLLSAHVALATYGE